VSATLGPAATRLVRSFAENLVCPFNQRHQGGWSSKCRVFPTKSASTTLRAREHVVQTWMDTPSSIVLGKVSASGGQPSGTTASATGLRISDTASPSKKIWTLWPASANALACKKGKAAFVRSSEPHGLLISTFMFIPCGLGCQRRRQSRSLAKTLQGPHSLHDRLSCIKSCIKKKMRAYPVTSEYHVFVGLLGKPVGDEMNSCLTPPITCRGLPVPSHVHSESQQSRGRVQRLS
jgi:hypothetical protein